MNKLKLILIVLASTFISTSVYAQDKNSQATIRSQISTGMAKVLTSNDVIPDDEDDTIECDGSGYITHGDGHRTKCEGCKKCNKGSVSVLQSEPTVAKQEHKFNVYHFGAKWCSPCVKMKNGTWKDKPLKNFMEENDCKLFLLDEANSDHKELFRYYRIKSYPTVIVLDRNNLQKPLTRVSGYVSAVPMIKIIKDSIKSDE